MTTANVPAKTEDKSIAPTIRGLLEGEIFREQLAKALPKHLAPERFVRIAVTTMTRTPMLAQCDQASFFNALLTLSQLGLEPDGRRAHLIPFKNNQKGIVECQLIIDYKGIVELISNAGDVANIHADIVCKNDKFVFDKGVLVQHTINFQEPRGEVYATYALIRFKDGTEKCEVMNREEVESIRKRSKAADRGPWVTDWNEMAKKTVFRRASKWVKLSPEQREVIEKDDDQFVEHVPTRRDTGANLLDRFNLGQQHSIKQGQAASAAESGPVNADGKGLEGNRLKVWEKVAEAAAGDVFEMDKVISNLSGGKVKNKEDLIKADDKTVAEIMGKFGGK